MVCPTRWRSRGRRYSPAATCPSSIFIPLLIHVYIGLRKIHRIFHPSSSHLCVHLSHSVRMFLGIPYELMLKRSSQMRFTTGLSKRFLSRPSLNMHFLFNTYTLLFVRKYSLNPSLKCLSSGLGFVSMYKNPWGLDTASLYMTQKLSQDLRHQISECCVDLFQLFCVPCLEQYEMSSVQLNDMW